MRRFAAALALAPLLAGCIDLAPGYHRPAPAVPAVVANSQGAPDAASKIEAWRAFFGDARLTAVIDKALTNNQDLRAAVANVQIARAGWLTARSQLAPHLSAEASATYSDTPASVVLGPGAQGSYNESIFAAEFAVPSYELDLFGRLRNQNQAALQQYFANRWARDAAQITLVGEVAEAWLTVGADRSTLAVANATLAEANQSLGLTQAKFDHGEAAQSDIDQGRGLVAQASADVGRDTVQVAQDRDALDLLCGAPVDDASLPAGIDDEAKVLGDLPTGVDSSVLLARPDVLEAEDQLKAADADIGAARAAFFPQITLTGSGGVTSTALASLFSPGSAAWSFAPQLIQPIFDAGANRAGLIQAKGQRDLAQADYQKAIQTAFREVADALAQRSQIDQQLAAQQTAVDADADALRLIEAEYRRGSASELDVLTAEANLYGAEQSLTTVRLTKATNLVALYQALGGGVA